MVKNELSSKFVACSFENELVHTIYDHDFVDFVSLRRCKMVVI